MSHTPHGQAKSLIVNAALSHFSNKNTIMFFQKPQDIFYRFFDVFGLPLSKSEQLEDGKRQKYG